jgi:2-succinyl-6-hydroxy-2,4-cyclohexadiene-1-carboxylate synthase
MAASCHLMLLHGFLGSPADWAPLGLQALGSCHTPALPGHGSPPAEWPGAPGDSDALLDQLESELLALPRPRFLLGYSLGGRLALALALRTHHTLDGLVLLASSTGIADPADRMYRRNLDHERALALEKDFPAFLEQWYRMPLFGSLMNRPAYPGMLARRLAGDPGALALAIEALSPGRMPFVDDTRLATISCPLCVLSGGQDPGYLAVGHALCAAVPGAKAVVLPEAAHALLEEDPGGCALAITAFVKNILAAYKP